MTETPANLAADAAEPENQATTPPPGVDENYANKTARTALDTLLDNPDFPQLADFLNSLQDGYLVVDVTGMPGGKKGPRIRATRSTKGQLVLPLFTSMAALRAAHGEKNAGRGEVKGAVMPSRQALSLIGSDRFVAAEFDKGGRSLVVLRKYIVRLLGTDEPLTVDDLTALR